jgi:hypothetical protein
VNRLRSELEPDRERPLGVPGERRVVITASWTRRHTSFVLESKSDSTHGPGSYPTFPWFWQAHAARRLTPVLDDLQTPTS